MLCAPRRTLAIVNEFADGAILGGWPLPQGRRDERALRVLRIRLR
jgi:hypothetical protein